jgi:CNT family concentrative nucleoside transporter
MRLISAKHINSKLAYALAFLFCFLAKSTFAQTDPLAGKSWERSVGKIAFNKDKTFDANDADLTEFIGGNWFVQDKNLFLIQNTDTARFSFTIIDENRIAINLESGKTLYYVEQKAKNNSGFSYLGFARGFLGLLIVLGIAYVMSSDRRAINWKLVAKGMVLQLLLAILVLKVPFFASIFDVLSKIFTKVVNMSHNGATFIFASFGETELNPVLMNFVTWILPSVIFFSALSSLLYYWGILQKFVYVMAWIMYRTMGLSGAESVAAAGNIFLGQTEAPLLVKPYLETMSKSELLSLMVGGMATIAGGVLAAYIGFLGKGDVARELYFAKHLLTASIMSAPAAIVFAKILYPEKEQVKRDLSVPKDKLGGSPLEAIANGTTDGVRLAVNVASMLIVFISIIALCNYILNLFGNLTSLNSLIAQGGNYNSLSFEFIMGHIFAPIAWLMGVPWQDALIFGQLLGEKTILNEFVAYPHLGELQDRMTQKSVLMATYALCGFANFASIGIQIGGIGALVPGRKSELAKFGVKALIGGTLACLSTAVLVGMIF